jgi:L-asparaginase / beta-aspartyl-peptidase
MYTIAIHGGAGVISKGILLPDEEKLYMEGLGSALNAGYALLELGENALDAVTAAVTSLENNHLFNAGRGSVFNADGKQEMEASIMWGETLDAGAVCGIRNVKNPIQLARAVMENSPHVFLNGVGAEDFAREMGLSFEEDGYFFTTHRSEELRKAKENIFAGQFAGRNFGTVGAVALDQYGNLAAATSTGGTTNKAFGRIGDSPVIGSGTYANNKTCAVSCTGDGEFFIRGVVAYDISCLMEYKVKTLEEACQFVIMDKMVKLGGEGGVVAVDVLGNTSLVFNSPGMYRGYRKKFGEAVIEIY